MLEARWAKFVELIGPFGKRAGGVSAGVRCIVFANRKDTVVSSVRQQ